MIQALCRPGRFLSDTGIAPSRTMLGDSDNVPCRMMLGDSGIVPSRTMPERYMPCTASALRQSLQCDHRQRELTVDTAAKSVVRCLLLPCRAY